MIPNNEPGEAAELLRRYDEPAWNNPVVRFFDGEGEELLPRRDGVWRGRALTERMLAALAEAGREVPAYLRIAYQEELSEGLERVAFAMHCFWKGEAVLGGLEGVHATRVGWLDGREVVEVSFDERRLPFDELVRRASSTGCADRVFVSAERHLGPARQLVGDRASRRTDRPREAAESDRSHYLRRSPLGLLPLTPLQRTRVNSALEASRDPAPLLSPRQRELLRRIRAALASDGTALDGLCAPEALGELEGYEAALRERLDGLGHGSLRRSRRGE